MALTLTEDLIRNRVGLQHDNLEDVKSLALPGTYHEKVVSLGTSLRKFTRLKHLDLSRNNISSLQGLEHLKLLEKLNLYYNNVETLDELKRLKHNPNLKELDLRLNPVTRTETDYRLYLIHMLPALTKLDDRSVRDRERQGALIHFSSGQATEMTYHPRVEEPPPKLLNPRAEHVKSLGSGRVLDDDDVELLDLIARTGGDLRQPRPLTGSNVKEPSSMDYSTAGLKKLDPPSLDGPQIPMPQKKKPPAEVDDVMAAYKKKYPNIPDVCVSEGDPHHQLTDQNLEFTDEADAYNKFKSHGYFTPNPAPGEDLSASYVQTERDTYPQPPARVQLERTRNTADPEADLDNGPGHRRSNSVPAERLEYQFAEEQPSVECYTEAEKRVPSYRGPPKREVEHSNQKSDKGFLSETPQSKLFLFQMLDLVDRYWNGTKSLHKNSKFKGLAFTAIEDYLRTSANQAQDLEIRQLRDELVQVRKNNSRIRRQEELSKSSLEDSAATEAHLKASLQKAFTDVELLKDKIQSLSSDNKRLQSKLQSQQDTYTSQKDGSTFISSGQLDELVRKNEALQREVEKQQIKVKQFKQMQELSSMLQESHKSLVQTNDHLLKELNQTRQRHQHEVEQLSWSYSQLKKTLSGPSPVNVVRGDNNASALLYDSVE